MNTRLKLEQLAPGKAIEQLYTGLISGFTTPDAATLHSADHDWDQNRSLYVTQGDQRGIFNQYSVEQRYGSHGIDVVLQIEAPRGREELKLKVDHNSSPAFTINPVPSPHDILCVHPVRPDHAQLRLPEAFNFNNIITRAKSLRQTTDPRPWYAVSFRSEIAPDADNETLLEYDRQAYETALAAPELVYYYGGPRDKRTGWAHSFCLWEDRDAARRVSRNPRHDAATSLARTAYREYVIEKFAVHHHAGRVILQDIR